LEKIELPSKNLYQKKVRGHRIRATAGPSLTISNVQQQGIVLPIMQKAFTNPENYPQAFTSGIVNGNHASSAHWKYLSTDSADRCNIQTWHQVEISPGNSYYYRQFTDSNNVLSTITAYQATHALNAHFSHHSVPPATTSNDPTQFPTITLIQTTADTANISRFSGFMFGMAAMTAVTVCLGLTVIIANGLAVVEGIEIFGVVCSFGAAGGAAAVVLIVLAFIAMVIAFVLQVDYYLSYNIFNYSNHNYVLQDYYVYNLPSEPQWKPGETKMGPKSTPPPPWGGNPIGTVINTTVVTQENASKWHGLSVCLKMKSDNSSDPIYFYFSKTYGGSWYADVHVGEAGSAEKFVNAASGAEQKTKTVTYGDNTIVMHADSTSSFVASFIIKQT